MIRKGCLQFGSTLVVMVLAIFIVALPAFALTPEIPEPVFPFDDTFQTPGPNEGMWNIVTASGDAFEEKGEFWSSFEITFVVPENFSRDLYIYFKDPDIGGALPDSGDMGCDFEVWLNVQRKEVLPFAQGEVGDGKWGEDPEHYIYISSADLEPGTPYVLKVIPDNSDVSNSVGKNAFKIAMEPIFGLVVDTHEDAEEPLTTTELKKSSGGRRGGGSTKKGGGTSGGEGSTGSGGPPEGKGPPSDDDDDDGETEVLSPVLKVYLTQTCQMLSTDGNGDGEKDLYFLELPAQVEETEISNYDLEETVGEALSFLNMRTGEIGEGNVSENENSASNVFEKPPWEPEGTASIRSEEPEEPVEPPWGPLAIIVQPGTDNEYSLWEESQWVEDEEGVVTGSRIEPAPPYILAPKGYTASLWKWFFDVAINERGTGHQRESNPLQERQLLKTVLENIDNVIDLNVIDEEQREYFSYSFDEQEYNISAWKTNLSLDNSTSDEIVVLLINLNKAYQILGFHDLEVVSNDSGEIINYDWTINAMEPATRARVQLVALALTTTYRAMLLQEGTPNSDPPQPCVYLPPQTVIALETGISYDLLEGSLAGPSYFIKTLPKTLEDFLKIFTEKNIFHFLESLNNVPSDWYPVPAPSAADCGG